MTLSTKKNKDSYFKIDLAIKPGRPRKFPNPNALALVFNDYVDFIFENKLEEGVAFHYQGDVTDHNIKKMRPLTLEGFCNFADITLDTFHNYEKIESNKELPTFNKFHADFLGLCTRIREIIYTHQYEGAAAGLLNPAIVARKLNIAEVVKGGIMSLPPSDMSEENVKKINDFLEGKY